MYKGDRFKQEIKFSTFHETYVVDHGRILYLGE